VPASITRRNESRQWFTIINNIIALTAALNKIIFCTKWSPVQYPNYARLRRRIRTVYMFTRRRRFRMLSDCYNIIIIILSFFLSLLFSLVGYHRPTSYINSDLFSAPPPTFVSVVLGVPCTVNVIPLLCVCVRACRVLCESVRCAHSEPPTVSTSQFSTPK